jgi:hypothetical protein
MGVDVYTPCYTAMTEACGEWHELQQRYQEWQDRPTVESQDWTEQDTKDYREISEAIGRMELKAGHFRHRSPFRSLLPVMAKFESGEDYFFKLTPAEVSAYLEEWRHYLRIQWVCGKHEERWANGFGDPVPSPFDDAVRRFKNWCQVYRLGEGCYVG